LGIRSRTTKINDLLGVVIVWAKHPATPTWLATVDGEVCTLTMNDFPDEPLYTLKWRNGSIDLDGAPASWSIPRE
jgi:hypothetical protein